jgi:hypothetical protein
VTASVLLFKSPASSARNACDILGTLAGVLATMRLPRTRFGVFFTAPFFFCFGVFFFVFFFVFVFVFVFVFFFVFVFVFVRFF